MFKIYDDSKILIIIQNRSIDEILYTIRVGTKYLLCCLRVFPIHWTDCSVSSIHRLGLYVWYVEQSRNDYSSSQWKRVLYSAGKDEYKPLPTSNRRYVGTQEVNSGRGDTVDKAWCHPLESNVRVRPDLTWPQHWEWSVQGLPSDYPVQPLTSTTGLCFNQFPSLLNFPWRCILPFLTFEAEITLKGDSGTVLVRTSREYPWDSRTEGVGILRRERTLMEEETRKQDTETWQGIPLR